jgi:hypothetical protein
VRRRIAVACAVFAAGVLAGTAVLQPGRHDRTKQERQAADAVSAASGGTVVQAACAFDHCGVVVRVGTAAACQGWVVPIRGGELARPARTALVQC